MYQWICSYSLLGNQGIKSTTVQGHDVHAHKLAISPERTQLVTEVSLDTWIGLCIYSLLDIALHKGADFHVLRQRESHSLKPVHVQVPVTIPGELGTCAQLFGIVPEAGRTTPELVPCALQATDWHYPLAWRICCRRPRCRFLPDPDYRVPLHQRRSSVSPPSAHKPRASMSAQYLCYAMTCCGCGYVTIL